MSFPHRTKKVGERKREVGESVGGHVKVRRQLFGKESTRCPIKSARSPTLPVTFVSRARPPSFPSLSTALFLLYSIHPRNEDDYTETIQIYRDEYRLIIKSEDNLDKIIRFSPKRSKEPSSRMGFAKYVYINVFATRVTRGRKEEEEEEG